MKFNIAIDGPSAAGKSTIADMLGKKLNYSHLDTGAMYRCIALAAIVNNVDLTNEEQIVDIIATTKLDMKSDGSIYLNDKLISDEIRSEQISMAASNISKFSKVREALVKMQQDIALNNGYIIDGRDIGTVVLKDAKIKIYLTATSEARGIRRHKQNLAKGFESDLQKIIKDIEIRDYQDMNREHSPLKKADDALELDSSNISIDEVINIIEDYIKSKEDRSILWLMEL